MSGTSSRISSSTSGRGRRSRSRPGARVHEDRVAGADLHADEVLGQLDDPLFVGPADNQGALAVLEQLLQDHDLAGQFGIAGEDHVERLVEDDFLAPAELDLLQLRVQGNPHLATGREHVGGAVLVDTEERAIGRRRLGELLDLLAQGGDVLACLTQGVGELLVLRDRLGQLTLGLEQLLLQGADPLRGVLQPPAEVDHLLLEEPWPARAVRLPHARTRGRRR